MLYKNVLFVAFAALATASPIRRDIASDAEDIAVQALNSVPGLAEDLSGLGSKLTDLSSAASSSSSSSDSTTSMNMADMIDATNCTMMANSTMTDSTTTVSATMPVDTTSTDSSMTDSSMADSTADETPDAADLAPPTGSDAAAVDLPPDTTAPGATVAGSKRDVNAAQVEADDSPAPVASVAAAPKSGPDAAFIDLPAGDVPPPSLPINNAVGARDINTSQVQADDSPAPVASVAAAPKSGPDAAFIDLPAGDVPPPSLPINNAVGARDVNPTAVEADDSPAPVSSVAAAPKSGPDAAFIDLPAGDVPPPSLPINNAVGARDVNPTAVEADDSPAPVASVAAAPKSGPDAAFIDLPAGDVPPPSLPINNAVGARDVNPTAVEADDSPAPVASVAAAPKSGPDDAFIDLPAGDVPPPSLPINNAVGA